MQPSKLLKTLLGLLPFLEIAGFIIVGGWIGVLPTLMLVILTTMFGFAILRLQGFITLRNMQRNLAAGQHPQANMLDNTLLMLGGLLLILPGFITDTAGLLLLIPPLRLLVIRWLITTGMAKPSSHGNVIEGEFHRDD